MMASSRASSSSTFNNYTHACVPIAYILEHGETTLELADTFTPGEQCCALSESMGVPRE